MRNEKSIIIFSLSILTAIIILEVIIYIYLRNTSNLILKNINNTENFIKSDQWNKAKSSIESASKEWNKIEEIWALITNHHEIDNITVSLKTAKEFIDTKEKADALASLESLKHYISHIPKMEKISLENIF
ncbi:DUF4363 family protein [Caloramator sp. E03]|uniref:DUF4363 family protein n=1 Tax=Caloramator sp. E03 TaxID=2576307 RepID=UPI00143DE913|nr:DUF4363 family protein [Caloramator sp. E03]